MDLDEKMKQAQEILCADPISRELVREICTNPKSLVMNMKTGEITIIEENQHGTKS